MKIVLLNEADFAIRFSSEEILGQILFWSRDYRHPETIKFVIKVNWDLPLIPEEVNGNAFVCVPQRREIT